MVVEIAVAVAVSAQAPATEILKPRRPVFCGTDNALLAQQWAGGALFVEGPLEVPRKAQPLALSIPFNWLVQCWASRAIPDPSRARPI